MTLRLRRGVGKVRNARLYAIHYAALVARADRSGNPFSLELDRIGEVLCVFSGAPPEVSAWLEETLEHVLEPLLALMHRISQGNSLPRDHHRVAVDALGRALSRRFSPPETRKRAILLFQRFHTKYANEESLRYTIAQALSTLFDVEQQTPEAIDRIGKALDAMKIVRGRGRRKPISKWDALSSVLELYGDTVSAETLRRIGGG